MLSVPTLRVLLPQFLHFSFFYQKFSSKKQNAVTHIEYTGFFSPNYCFEDLRLDRFSDITRYIAQRAAGKPVLLAAGSTGGETKSLSYSTGDRNEN